ncbi:hypothetical protein AALA69_03205 [Eggerthellaceae bacterium 24-137]
MKVLIREGEANEPAFDRKMYGALLRHRRMEGGYKKVEDFIDALLDIGLDIPKATLYRIERGDQEPAFAFISAANLVLFGDVHSGIITDSCIPEEWSSPEDSDAVMRVLRKGGVIQKYSDNSASASERARYYEELLKSTNSYDFDVFPNNSCTKDDLFMTVRYGYGDPGMADPDDIESYQITDLEDVERSILNFIKCRDFDISGEEIDRLIKYGQRKMKPHLIEYGLI